MMWDTKEMNAVRETSAWPCPTRYHRHGGIILQSASFHLCLRCSVMEPLSSRDEEQQTLMSYLSNLGDQGLVGGSGGGGVVQIGCCPQPRSLHFQVCDMGVVRFV